MYSKEVCQRTTEVRTQMGTGYVGWPACRKRKLPGIVNSTQMNAIVFISNELAFLTHYNLGLF